MKNILQTEMQKNSKDVRHFKNVGHLKLLSVLFLIILSTIAHSQSFTVFDVDTSNFPIMKAKFFAFDADGEQLTNLSPADFEVTENEQMRNVISVSCPAPQPPEALSSVLVMDASGSMEGGNLDLAKEAAKAWIEGLPLGKSECAITAFANTNYMVQDFSTDKAKLINAANTLFASGGTDYDAAMLNPLAGGLQVTKNGKHKRVIVFLSDGYPSQEPQVNQIISEANNQDVTVFSVTLGMRCPESMREISEQTGGQWFENVTTAEQAKAVYMAILQTAQGGNPCEIEWESDGCDFAKNVQAAIPSYGIQNNFKYSVSYLYLPHLEIEPSSSVAFGKIKPGETAQKQITITAKNEAVKITGSSTSNNVVKVLKYGGTNPPFTLNPGDSRTITLEYAPLDSSFIFANIELETDACAGNKIFCNGGWLGKSKGPTLKVTHPNGGEIFVAGSDTVVTWEGILPEDSVQIEFSPDNGGSWDTLSAKSKDLKEIWKKLPKISSDECLIKIKEFGVEEDDSDSLATTLGLGDLEEAKFSPDGKKIASAGGRGIVIWDAEKSEIINIIDNETKVSSIDWSPDGKKIAGNSGDFVKIWDANTYEVLLSFGGHNEFVRELVWSPDGKNIASGDGDGKVIIWNASTGSENHNLSGFNSRIYSIAFSPDGSKIASGNKKSIKVWNASNGSLIKSIDNVHTIGVNTLSWKPDGSQLASGSNDETIKLWNTTSWNKDLEIDNGDRCRDILWTSDGKKLVAIANFDIKIYYPGSGASLGKIDGGSSTLLNISFNNDESKILAVKSFDNIIKIFDFEKETHIDTFFGYMYHGVHFKWSANSDDIVSSGYGIIYLFEGINQEKQKVLEPNKSSVGMLDWSSNKEKIVYTAKHAPYKIYIYDVVSGTIFPIISNNYVTINGIRLSPDDSKIASFDDNNAIKIWNASDGSKLFEMYGHGDNINDLDWSPDGSKIVTCGNDGKVYLWNASTAIEIWHKAAFVDDALQVEWSPDGQLIYVSHSDPKIKILNAANGNVVLSKQFNNTAKFLDVSPDGSKIACANRYKFIIRDATTLNIIKEYNTYYSIYGMQWNYDGSKIAVSSYEGFIQILKIEDKVEQIDTSDAVFTIVIPEGASKDIDMRKVLVGSMKDSIVSAFITNTGTYRNRIDSIYIENGDADQFSIPSTNFPFYVEAGQSKAVEFRFTPTEARVYDNAEIVIITQADTLIQNITGEGVEQKLEVVENLIDFGVVDVGNSKDTLQTVTIKNIGSVPITIAETKHNYPNDVDFSTLAGGGNFTLQPDETKLMDLRFAPSDVGRTSGTLEFHYNGVGSPAVVQLFGEGVNRSPEILANFEGFDNLICDSYSTNSVEIRNSGGLPLEISELNFTGANPNDFAINETLPLTVHPDSIINLNLSFIPQSTGDKSAILNIKSNAVPDSLYQIQLIGRKDSVALAPEYEEIDLGIIFFNETIDTNINIRNTGTLSNKGYFTNQQDFQLSSNEITLASNENGFINIHYPGSSVPVQIEEDIILTDTICNNETIIKIYLTVSPNPVASLKAPTLEAYPGDEIDVPIILNSQENMQIAGIETISADLTFNPTLLYPVGYDIERIDDKTAKIRIENIQADAQAGEVLKTINFTVGLGNAEECDLILSDAATMGGEAEISLINGKFDLLGVCYEGGARLINPSSESGITSISPNPTDGEIEIGLNLIEKGYTKLTIYNTMGEKLSSILSENIQITGEQTINLDISEYSSGIYFIVLKTPTHHFTEEVMIMK